MTVNPSRVGSGNPTGPDFARSQVLRAWEPPEEVVLHRHIIESPDLQPEDIGVLARLLVRDPSQPATIVALAKEFQASGWKMGESRFAAIFKRLKAAGHVQHVSEFNPETGRPHWVFKVYRNPANNEQYVTGGLAEASQVSAETVESTDPHAGQTFETVETAVSRGQSETVESTDPGAKPWKPGSRESTVSRGQSRNRGNRGFAPAPPHPPVGREELPPPNPQQRDGDGMATPAHTAEQLAEAADWLMRLPGKWALGAADARDTAPLLLDQAGTCGWTLDAMFRQWLTRREEGKTAPRSYLRTLRFRLDNLQLRDAVLAADDEQSTPAPAGPDGTIPWCGKCNNGERPVSLMMRLVDIPGEDDQQKPCPDCHPAAMAKTRHCA